MFYKEADLAKVQIFAIEKLYFIYIGGRGNIFRKIDPDLDFFFHVSECVCIFL